MFLSDPHRKIVVFVLFKFNPDTDPKISICLNNDSTDDLRGVFNKYAEKCSHFVKNGFKMMKFSDIVDLHILNWCLKQFC